MLFTVIRLVVFGLFAALMFQGALPPIVQFYGLNSPFSLALVTAILIIIAATICELLYRCFGDRASD